MQMMDIDNAQRLREAASLLFSGQSVHDLVGAIEMLTCDLIMALPAMTHEDSKTTADNIAKDVRQILDDRYAALAAESASSTKQ